MLGTSIDVNQITSNKNKIMKKLNHIVPVLAVFALFTVVGPNKALAATTPTLGAASTYGVLSDTYVNTNVPSPTTINGDVGFNTAPAVTPLGLHINYGNLAPFSAAGTAQGAALTNLNGQGCDFTFVAPAVDLSATLEHPSTTYAPGVYCNTGALSVGSGITLGGAGTYIFRSGGALNLVTGSIITLAPGASACDVFWTPNGATTINANSTFVGTVIPVSQDITILDASTWIGRALTFGHTVTTPDTNVVITAPSSCNPPQLTVTKVVINDNGRNMIVSDFPLFVGATAVVSGVSNTFAIGSYVVTETTNTDYAQSFSGDCDASGNITLNTNDNKVCTITNNDVAASSISGGRRHDITTSIITGQVLGASTTTTTFVAPPHFYIPSLPNTGFADSNPDFNRTFFTYLGMFIVLSLVVVAVEKKHKI